MLINSKIAVQNEGSVCSDRKGSVCAEYPSYIRNLLHGNYSLEFENGTDSQGAQYQLNQGNPLLIPGPYAPKK